VTRGFALAAAAAAAIAIGLDAARSAMLVLVVATVLFTILGKSLSRRFRGIAAMTVLAALTGSLFVTRSFDRWLGGDSAVTIGDQAINTNGRVTMWSAVIDSIDSRSSVVFGDGPGTSSRVAEAVNGLSSPLNEFVRVLADFGLMGLAAMVTLLGGLLLSGIRCSSKVNSFEGGPTVIALAVGFVILSLTESMLSYSWVLVPTGIIIGFVYNKVGQRS
jgi:O-antigen ligase